MIHAQRTAAAMLFVAVLILGAWAWSQDNVESPSDVDPATVGAVADSTTASSASPDVPSVSESAASTKEPVTSEPAVAPPRQGVMVSLWIFVLAVFLGIELISKVPPTLHTPLMSGSNAISGITLVGAVIVAAAMVNGLSTTAGIFARFLGFIAVTLAMINAVGGFLVTHRMLAMFTRK